jgi:hypothetical protein
MGTTGYDFPDRFLRVVAQTPVICNCRGGKTACPENSYHAHTVEKRIFPSPKQPLMHDGTGKASRLLFSLFASNVAQGKDYCENPSATPH